MRNTIDSGYIQQKKKKLHLFYVDDIFRAHPASDLPGLLFLPFDIFYLIFPTYSHPPADIGNTRRLCLFLFFNFFGKKKELFPGEKSL